MNFFGRTMCSAATFLERHVLCSGLKLLWWTFAIVWVVRTTTKHWIFVFQLIYFEIFNWKSTAQNFTLVVTCCCHIFCWSSTHLQPSHQEFHAKSWPSCATHHFQEQTSVDSAQSGRCRSGSGSNWGFEVSYWMDTCFGKNWEDKLRMSWEQIAIFRSSIRWKGAAGTQPGPKLKKVERRGSTQKHSKQEQQIQKTLSEVVSKVIALATIESQFKVCSKSTLWSIEYDGQAVVLRAVSLRLFLGR